MNPLVLFLGRHAIDYPTPSNLNSFWNFGFLSAFCLILQIFTGIFLAMNYTPHVDFAMASVEHIMRDVDYGWLIRYAHANGASMFFIMVYLHIARGLYYGSYMSPKELPWCVGVFIFLLMMATAFMGYVLPWGQMSFWGSLSVPHTIFFSYVFFSSFIFFSFSFLWSPSSWCFVSFFFFCFRFLFSWFFWSLSSFSCS